jgi:hypothetical protein
VNRRPHVADMEADLRPAYPDGLEVEADLISMEEDHEGTSRPAQQS